jgi:hypothetical protein
LLQFFHARLRSLFFVSVAARNSAEHDPDKQGENDKQQNHTNPRAEHGVRLLKIEVAAGVVHLIR